MDESLMGRFRVINQCICGLTLEATGTQRAPRSGNLRLCVHVGRTVMPVQSVTLNLICEPSGKSLICLAM
jgi:hypothetical protein